ncbi:hypothetical protein KDI_09030 [Dictyobacter arantiisoli]|uniref:Uncharacterized protein n=1 Tax=Dictyobacter arantiisoli TaxID=2014874 RepID=A0A5A5T8N8_9CHLR|nr:hypothetical protein KDI_09030 [Dictyobacter arantiisoli]
MQLFLNVRGDQKNADSSNQDAEHYENEVQCELCRMDWLQFYLTQATPLRFMQCCQMRNPYPVEISAIRKSAWNRVKLSHITP